MPQLAGAAAAWAVTAWTSAVTVVNTAMVAAAGAALPGLSFSAQLAVANFATKAVVFGGLAAASAALMRPNIPSSGTSLDFKPDPKAPVRGAMGYTALGGNKVFQATWGYKKVAMSLGVALSLGPIDQVPRFEADGATVSFTGQQNEATGFYAADMWQRTTLGLPGDAALLPPTGLKYGNPGLTGWGTQHAAPQTAFSFWTMVLAKNPEDRDVFTNGVPDPRWVGRWMKVWQPRYDSTYPGGSGPQRRDDWRTWGWSENPYDHALAWVRGHYKLNLDGSIDRTKRIAGIGAPDSAIDIPAFVEGANIADANGWTISGEWSTGDGKFQTLLAMLQAGGGEPISRGAQISVLVNTPRVSTYTYTRDDLIGQAEIRPLTPRRERKNTIIPRYKSEANGWQYVPAGEVTSSVYRDEDRGEPRSLEIEYTHVRNAKQAGQLAAYDLANLREGLTATLPSKVHLMHVHPGACITVDVPELALAGQKFIVRRATTNHQAASVTLELRSESDGKHAWALGQAAQPAPSPSLSAVDPKYVPPPAAEDWTVLPKPPGDGGVSQPIFVIEAPVETTDIVAVIIKHGPSASGPWTDGYEGSPRADGRYEVAGLTPGQTYCVSLQYVAKNGAKSDPDIKCGIVVGDLIAGDTTHLKGEPVQDILDRLTDTATLADRNRQAVEALEEVYGDTASAATSAAVAAASEAAAVQAKADAIIAKGEAQASATTAAQKATDAAGSATSALTSKNDAAASATTATQKATDAAGSAATATQQAGLAAGSATAAGGSASAAAGSASTAATKATEAGNSATAANAAKVAAESARDTADQKATAAASSASAAATSSTQAGQSASAAQTAKTDAETARAGAETAQTSAANSATTATGAAATATTQAGIATTAKNDAQAASSAAVTARNQASSFADAAGISAAASQASSVTASTARDEALAALAQQGRLNLVQKGRVSAAPNAFPDTASGWGYRLVGGTTEIHISYVGPLKTNTPYSISFKARRVSGTTSTINVDLFPDTLPERVFTVTSDQWTEYKWEGLTSAHADMTSENVQLRFFRASLPSGNTFEVADIKLEEGATASAWTPNPKDIELSASAAATSASNAAASQTAAESAASAATTAKTQAETARGQAQTAASQASQSETNAAGSAASASSAAQNAATSRDQASGFATAASGSASTASTKATEAGNSAAAAAASQVSATAAKDAAVSAKDGAETAREQAQSSATAAATSASSASASETAAGQQAAAASGSATAAATRAGEALTYRNQAAGSASDAAGSAVTASNASGTSVSARDAAIGARNDAQAAAATAIAQASSASASAASAQISADLAVSVSNARQNLLPNSTGLLGVQGWDGLGAGSQIGAEPKSTDGSRFIWYPSASGAANQQAGTDLIDFDAGVPVSISAEVYASGMTGGQVRAYVAFINAAGAAIDYLVATWTGNTSGWQTIKAEGMTSPAGTVAIRVAMDTFGATWAASGRAAGWRKIKVERGSTATPWNDPASTAALSASLNITAAVAADAQTRLSTVRFDVTGGAGGDPFQIWARADASGSSAGLVASELSFASVVGGTVVKAMKIIGGEVFFMRPIYIDVGSRRLIVGPGGTWVLWFGPNTIAAAAATRTNGYFALGSDGKVYYGNAELGGGGKTAGVRTFSSGPGGSAVQTVINGVLAGSQIGVAINLTGGTLTTNNNLNGSIQLFEVQGGNTRLLFSQAVTATSSGLQEPDGSWGVGQEPSAIGNAIGQYGGDVTYRAEFVRTGGSNYAQGAVINATVTITPPI